MTVREHLKNIRETYGNREILEAYADSIVNIIADRYYGLSITISNPNKDFGLDYPDKHIEINAIPSNNERLKFCKSPIRIYMTREGTRKSDNVKLRIICNETFEETGSSSFDLTDSLPVSDELIKQPVLLIDHLFSLLQMLDFYILGKPISDSFIEDVDEPA